MPEKTHYIKGIQYESIVGNAFGIRFSSQERPEITDAYRTLLAMKSGIKIKGNNLEKQFLVLRKHLAEAIKRFQQRNTDGAKKERLEELLHTTKNATSEEQIDWVLDAVNELMPIK